MIKVEGLAQPGLAYQYTAATADTLKGLSVPTGQVTIQQADEMNRTPGRCYVPTTWGTAILEEGDWFVVYDLGIVSAFTGPQFEVLFSVKHDEELAPPAEEPAEDSELSGAEVEVLASMEAKARSLTFKQAASVAPVAMASTVPLPTGVAKPVLRFRVMSDGAQWLPSFEAYCVNYRHDYVVLSEENPRGGDVDFRVLRNATGAEVLAFGLGELIDCFADGRLEIVSEGPEA